MSVGAQLCRGRYTLVRELGKTGTANAWRATNNETGASVIVKVLHKHVADDVDLRERIFGHVAKLAAFDHPGFLWVLEPRIEEDEGVYAYVTEFVEGESLRDAVLDGYLSPEDALSIVLQVGDALAFAHDQGIVHRDVNPSNILIDATDTPRLIEFGPPRPRNDAGMQKDRLTDIYGLSMTVVFALFRDDLPMLEVVRDAPSFIGSLPCRTEIKDVLCEAANIDANQRYRDTRAFCEALEQAAARGVADSQTEAPHNRHGIDEPEEEYSDPLIRSVEVLPAVRVAAMSGKQSREDPLDAIIESARSGAQLLPVRPATEDSNAGSLRVAVEEPTSVPATAPLPERKPEPKLAGVELSRLTAAPPRQPEKSRPGLIALGIALVVAVLIFASLNGSDDPGQPHTTALAAEPKTSADTTKPDIEAPRPPPDPVEIPPDRPEPVDENPTQSDEPEATTGSDDEEGWKSTDDGDDTQNEVVGDPQPKPVDKPVVKQPPKPIAKPVVEQPPKPKPVNNDPDPKDTLRSLRETLRKLEKQAQKSCSEMAGNTSVSATLTLDGEAGTVEAVASGSHARTNLGRCVIKAIHSTKLKPYKTEQQQVTLTIDFAS